MSEMDHPTDDELIEHFCGEAAPAGAARIQAHLRECDTCQRAWDDITATLTMVHETVPEPPEAFERVVWARVQNAITPRTAWTWRVWVPAGALAAAVIAAVAMPAAPPAPNGTRPVTQPVTTTAGADTTESDELRQTTRVLYAALDEHFQQAEALLIELRNASDRDNLGLERQRADDLVASGRLYRMTAESAGQQGLVRVLDDLEPLLVEIARAPRKIDSRDRAWLRTQIDDENLIFKVRALNTDIRDRVGIGNQ